ncbi:MAG: high frequency lysogenization protein HflD [Rhodobacteraceae bacterium]|nr:MAG: high frequency lysogenization protein HflD [Paracoccaceae bacterium]
MEFLLLGLLVGMAHAFEADHMAAIGALASSGKATPKRLAFLGASWGMGHTTTLFIIALPVILFGVILTERFAAGMEFAIGIMLVGLGAQVFYKLWKARVHLHLHEHGGKRHFHAHSHAGETMPHSENPHHHQHRAFSIRAYAVGLAHGAAGSAGLVALAAAATQNAVTALVYIMVFGVGSILGMAALTYAASWPLRLAEKTASKLLKTVQMATGVAAVTVGVMVMVVAAPVIWGAA